MQAVQGGWAPPHWGRGGESSRGEQHCVDGPVDVILSALMGSICFKVAPSQRLVLAATGIPLVQLQGAARLSGVCSFLAYKPPAWDVDRADLTELKLYVQFATKAPFCHPHRPARSILPREVVAPLPGSRLLISTPRHVACCTGCGPSSLAGPARHCGGRGLRRAAARAPNGRAPRAAGTCSQLPAAVRSGRPSSTSPQLTTPSQCIPRCAPARISLEDGPWALLGCIAERFPSAAAIEL